MIKALTFLEKIFKSPINLEILLILDKAGQPLSFSELCSFITPKISSALLSYYLHILEKEKVIQRELKINTRSGKLRFSFYSLTDKGKKLTEILKKLFLLIEGTES